MGSMKKWFGSLRSGNSKDMPEIASGALAAAKDQTGEMAGNIAGQGMDLSLIAVITAAVAAMLSDGSTGSALYPGFRVRRIRRLM